MEFPSGSESCESAWCAQSHRALLDRETGPDLTWQWTLAVAVCAALAGVVALPGPDPPYAG